MKRKRTQQKKLVVSDRHYFSLKGKTAEETLQFLAQKTFLTDWCYLNPILPDGKELCDLLVVFDTTAIIWQLKDVKLKDGHIKDSDYDKNIRQISGAFRKLSDLKTSVELNNPRRGKEVFDASKIGNYFLISAFFGDSPLTLKAMEKVKNKYVHVFNRGFTEIALNELDTISDFKKYIEEKEAFFQSKESSSIIVVGGEKELLGHYLMNERNFDKLKSGNYTSIMIDSDVWQDLISRKEYKAKVRANEISYFWDYLIDICHTGDNPEYEFIARELARSNRFERRNLAMVFMELRAKADEDDYGYSHRRATESGGITFCFLCHGDSDDDKSRGIRKTQLSAFCHIARGQLKNKKVIGIATDQKIKNQTAFDFCLINMPDWTKEDQEIMELNQTDTGILTKPIKTHKRFIEYPQV